MPTRAGEAAAACLLLLFRQVLPKGCDHGVNSTQQALQPLWLPPSSAHSSHKATEVAEEVILSGVTHMKAGTGRSHIAAELQRRKKKS